MATVKTGLFDTEDELSNRRKVDMSERMHRLQPDDQQFRVMLNQLGSKVAVREIVEWLESELLPRTSSMAASATSAESSITVTTGDGNTIFRNGAVVRNMETGEGYLVTSTSANSIGITRSWGGTAAASSTSAAKLLIVGNAAAQGASSGASHITQKVRAFNYIQDQRDPIWFSDFETSIDLYGGNEPGEELVQKGIEHARAEENSYFFGARDFNASASPGPMGSSGGAIEYISTYNTNASGALTPAEFDTFLEGPFSWGSKNKVLFAAPRVATVMSQMLRDVWQPSSVGDRKFGAKVDAFISGTYGWSIPIVVKREWADFDNSGTNYGTWAFLIDMDYVRRRYLRGKNTHIRRNIEEPSSTAEVHEYRTCFSLEFGTEKAHGILRGVTSYAAT
jgi:hypothetical protein